MPAATAAASPDAALQFSYFLLFLLPHAGTHLWLSCGRHLNARWFYQSVSQPFLLARAPVFCSSFHLHFLLASSTGPTLLARQLFPLHTFCLFLFSLSIAASTLRILSPVLVIISFSYFPVSSPSLSSAKAEPVGLEMRRSHSLAQATWW